MSVQLYEALHNQIILDPLLRGGAEYADWELLWYSFRPESRLR